MQYINDDRELLYEKFPFRIEELTIQQKNRLINLAKNKNLSIEEIEKILENYFESFNHEGITYNVNTLRFRAVLKKDKVVVLNSYFDELEDAIAARKEAEEKYFDKADSE
ncbi:hypothetical protein [Enterococcus rivorum]|uniref:Uncharacterized protein n=1 Tax=Enterococcus rivorum TaxID=762845 RepID=A0A1E5KWD2_9ENTE|nr:hypothetical protein [Enterococcus rivorum]MBP2099028.1 DNA-binding transcriptional MerR regulator [Enterococcus rivorum]OEH82175.1 hypothetical protein BCR26_13965 [Enterococcus rivorum]